MKIGSIVGMMGGALSMIFIIGSIKLLGLSFLYPLGVLLNILILLGIDIEALNMIVFAAFGGAIGGYIARKQILKKSRTKLDPNRPHNDPIPLKSKDI
jgi:hypothetical protein